MKAKGLCVFSVLFFSSLFHSVSAQVLTASIAQGSSVPVCAGSSIQLTGNPAGGTPPYSHAWTGDVGQLS